SGGECEMMKADLEASLSVSSSSAIQCRDVCRSYGKLRVLSSLNLTVPQGQIYGLLGPSGCGKTTLLKCIVGTLKISRGHISVLGKPPRFPGHEVPGRMVGYMPQDIALYNEFTISDTLWFFGRIHGLSSQETRERMKFLIEFLDLPQKDSLVRKLSGGQRRRVSLGAALLQNPQLLILDEPTVGVDPVLRAKIWQHLVQIVQGGQVSVIITTHYIEEARQANMVGLMRNGRLLAEENPEEIMRQHNAATLESAFLQLCEDSDQVGSQDSPRCPDHSERVSPASLKDECREPILGKEISTPSDTPKLKADWKVRARHVIPKCRNIVALTIKTMVRMRRNPGSLCFQFLLPVIQICLMCLCIGGDPNGIKVAVVNNETSSSAYSRSLLSFLDNTSIYQVSLSHSAAFEGIHNGEYWGIIEFGENFTTYLTKRMLHPRVSRDVVEGGSVHVWLDLTNRQIGIMLQKKLHEAFQAFVESKMGSQAYLVSVPVKFEEPIFGSQNTTFTTFVTPGAVLSTNFIPDRSRPGLTTTAIGAVDLQGAGGNWATVGRRSRGGRRVRRQREKRKGKSVGLRIGTLNVGTMTGKGRELADVMERRKVDILCVQETRWKGSKACSIGAGFKLFYYGVDSKRNGVGVVLKEEFVRNVLEVKRVSDRVMSLKLEIEGVMLNVVSGYAPQVGCELEEKERFWSELDEVMESIPTGERVVIGADFNGHVGEGNTGDEEVMGKFGVKERNLEGQMVVDFAKRMDMGVVNTYFQKREEHRVTYKSGGRRTQVDYILCRRGNLKEISDCKVVVGESVARQHRMVVCRMTLMVCKTKRSKIEKKTKWWKLKKEECCEEFRQKLRQALGGQVVLPDDWETTAEVIRETGRKVLGVSSGRRKEDKETWWWNEEVQDSVQRKRLAKKKWDMDRTEENRQEYKELQRRVKREVSKAKQKAYEELYTRLDTREGEKDLYRLARQRDRDGKDVQQVRVIKDRDGRVLTSEESVQRRWKEYFEELMNEENEREKRVEGVNSVEQKVDKIRKDEVRKALKRMKSGKAVGPDDIPVEVWKCLGEAAVEFLANLFNRVLESERMPEEWRRSVLVPIFKNKGDVQSCSNYRGIKLMSHTMKLWERVVEARLRKVVEICEQQYGFMPRKSTTDAIFALRILMEKYRDGQKELHCVFVDLEKAYDRVPREELWYCMRKSGVAEKYVRVVQDMYERSRTVVRCAVGQTEKFNVEVGLHQGSALSPFLFAIVMDQLSEEVRQESPWTMMFADDIVICSESREQVEENLERWRFALERRGMKVSRSKTEYMCVNEREGSGTVRLQGEEVKKVQEFKYLGSTVQSNGECGKEVKKRVQAGWNGWRKVSGVLCDRKISARIKGKVYRTVVRPAMLYGLETVSMRKRQESELEVAELKMLSITFYLAVGLTALSFVLERKEGLLDRCWVAGVSSLETMLAHLFSQILVISVQITLLLLFILLVFKPTGVVPPAAAVRPAAEGPGAAAAPDLTESEPQAQPAAQKPTGATPAPEKPRTAEPATAEPHSARPDQKKPWSTEKSSVGSGAVLEPPALSEAGTEVQGDRMETLDTTLVQGDGGDVDMVDEPVFKIPNEGSLFLIICLIVLQGVTGISFGLVISSAIDDEQSANQAALGIFYPNLIISGVIWPVECIPYPLRYLSLVLPQTYASEALRCIMYRGWGLSRMMVWRGFAVTLGWNTFFLMLATIILKLRT
ncbi:hypothetical protein QTP70_030294, partial [Hemibagrus guttatus]